MSQWSEGYEVGYASALAALLMVIEDQVKQMDLQETVATIAHMTKEAMDDESSDT